MTDRNILKKPEVTEYIGGKSVSGSVKPSFIFYDGSYPLGGGGSGSGSGSSQPSVASIDFLTALYSQFGVGTTNIDNSYTASKNETVLAICCESIGTGENTKCSYAQITTTGTKLWDNFRYSAYMANVDRDYHFTMSMISLQAGQTVTFQTGHSKQYSSQINLVFSVDTPGYVSDMLFESVIDNQKDQTLTFNPVTSGNYIIMAINTCPYASFGSASSQITAAQELSSYSDSMDTRISITIGQYNLSAGSSATLSASSTSSYATTIYAAWLFI